MESKLKLFFLIICLININFNGINAQEKKSYIGAVVDFASKHDASLTPYKVISENLNEYFNFIKEAKDKKADIIVFPECGLTSVSLPTVKDEILAYAAVIPDPTKKIRNPCDEAPPQVTEWAEHIRKLSCSAKTNNIYVVVNLPERCVNESSRNNDSDVIYNTNIVFDRFGNLTARYRKFNLFVEPGFSTTQTPELITFKTDFGVTFGTFICFDILFTSPSLDLLSKFEDVTDIVYPTAWFSELPFLTAVQTQAGWAKANGVNLLAAGYNHPEAKSGGSGVYTADGNMTFIMPAVHQSSIVYQEIPIIKKRKISVVSQHKPNPINPSLSGMMTQEENLENYTTELVKESYSNYKLCHNEFCCVFDITFNKINSPDYHYRMIVYHGDRVFGVLHHDIQVCGVVACTDETLKSCGKRVANPSASVVFDAISVKGDMFIKNGSFIPSYTDYHLGSTHHYFYNTSALDKLQKIEMKNLEPVKDLLAFGVYGTTYSSGDSFSASFSFLCLLVVVLISKIIY